MAGNHLACSCSANDCLFFIWNGDLAGTVSSLLHPNTRTPLLIMLVLPMVSYGFAVSDTLRNVRDDRSHGRGTGLFSFLPPGARAQNLVSPMVFEGFPIAVRFPKARNGNQETARCFSCPGTRESLFFQWFPPSAATDPSRAATFLGSRTPPCSKRCFTNGFCMILNKRTISWLVFFLEWQK